MPADLIERAIEIAKENKSNFGFALLKRKMHIGLVTCNLLLDELESEGIIKIANNQDQQYEVLI